MFLQRISRFSIVAAFCAASLTLVTQATSALSPSFTHVTAESFAHVDRTAKSDRLTRARGVQASANAIAIELTGPSDVVVRDRRGFILFAVDHSARTTIIGKQGGGHLTVPTEPAQTHEAVPEGCEGAFSPYAEPSKARILVDACRPSFEPATHFRDGVAFGPPVDSDCRLLHTSCSKQRAPSRRHDEAAGLVQRFLSPWLTGGGT